MWRDLPSPHVFSDKYDKYITFMAASTDESSIDESRIAKQWHQACPTLRTIILPKGRVWFQGEPGSELQAEGTSPAGDGDATADTKVVS